MPMTNTRERLLSEMETTDRFEVALEVLRAEASKPITKRLVEKVDAAMQKKLGPGDYAVQLRRIAGMTELEWGGYSVSQGNVGMALLIAHSDKSVPIADRYLADLTKHLATIHFRNAQRAEILDSSLPEQMDAAIATIRESLDTLQAMHDVGERYTVLPSARRIIEDLLDE